MEKKDTQIVTPVFRMAFPNLLAPREDMSKRLCYSVVALFPEGTDLTNMKRAAKAAAAAKWGDDEAKWPQGLNSPFTDGNTKGKTDGNGTFRVWKGYENTTAVSFKRIASLDAPVVVLGTDQLVTDPKEVYGGRWARAQVNAFAYEKGKERGIAFGLNMIQLREHDEPFVSDRDPAAVFGDESEPVAAVSGAKKSFLD